MAAPELSTGPTRAGLSSSPFATDAASGTLASSGRRSKLCRVLLVAV